MGGLSRPTDCMRARSSKVGNVGQQPFDRGNCTASITRSHQREAFNAHAAERAERKGSGGSLRAGSQWHMALQRTPRAGTVLPDLRGEGRSLRATWHQDQQVVVLSLWRNNVCVGSFRLAADEVPDLIATLRLGLDQAYDTARERVERLERPSQAG